MTRTRYFKLSDNLLAAGLESEYNKKLFLTLRTLRSCRRVLHSSFLVSFRTCLPSTTISLPMIVCCP